MITELCDLSCVCARRLIFVAHGIILFGVTASVQNYNAGRDGSRLEPSSTGLTQGAVTVAGKPPDSVSDIIYVAPFFISIATLSKSILNLLFERDFVKCLCVRSCNTPVMAVLPLAARGSRNVTVYTLIMW